MNSLLVAANVVIPLIILIAIGYLAASARWVSNDSFRQMNRLVFNVLLPCVLFENIYDVSIGEIVDPEMLLFGLGAIFLVFFCGIPLSGLLTREPQKRGVAHQAIFRSNFVLFGFPIVQSMYPGDRLGSVTVLIAIVIPIYNVLSVIALEIFRSNKINVAKIAVGIAKNPMIIAAAAGILFSVFKLGAPQAISRSLTTLATAATPVALIVLGGTFRMQTLGENRRLLMSMAMFKLVLVPAVFLSTAILFGFRDVELLTFVALFGSPAAVSSFSMAQQMGADSELAGQNLLLTTVLSVFTIFIWVSLLNYFALIV
ncbi:MAG: AEC family transporter [Oscillospiraceae bacterium]|nr:AEC family transporter [Oscillospiraceae bacterium]